MNDMLVGILGLAAIAATVISLTRGKMLPAMAFILWPSVLALANALPASLGKHLHLLLCALAVPLALSFDTDSYFYGMLPVMLGIGQAFGLEALSIAITMQILRLSATFICPMTAALLLATSMADVPIRNHIRASALYVWSFSFLCLVFAIFIGLVPL